ncbi:MAG: M48 family metallopeptidase [Candidatus Binatia bacterium]
MTIGPAAGLLLLLALGCAGAASADDKAIEDVDAGPFSSGAMAIGQAKDVDHARAEGLGLVPASPLDTYLNGILAKLLAQSPVTGVPARVYVRASGDWAAKSTADANIYVALGALLRLDNEDEVAALLAHEASHVVLGHADADVVQSAQQRAVQLSALAVEAQAVVDGARGKGDGGAGKPAAGSARVEEQSRALLLNTMLLSPAWTREQERDADRLGTDLLVRAGYAPQAMASLLRKQKTFETARAASPQAAAFDKQLLGVDTKQVVQQQAQKAAKNIGVKDPSGLAGLAGSALGGALDWGSKKVGEAQRSHPKTEERIVEIESYVAEEYSGAAAPALQVEAWDAAKEQDGTVDILENYIAAIEAKGKLADGDVAAARKLAKTSLSGPTKAHAYPNFVEAAVEISAGAPAPALAAYETALAGPEPAGAIYSEASVLYLETGKRDKAVEVIEAGYARLQEPPSLTVPLIRTYRLTGRQADADRVAAQCAARWPGMQGVCMGEAKGK